MRTVIVMALFFCLSTNLPAIGYPSFDPEPPKQSLKPGHYIVVAAFKANQENFARQYSQTLERNQIPAQFGFDASRNYYYVYLNVFEDFSQSIQEMEKARKSTSFTDAWVRVLKENQVINTALVSDVKEEEMVKVQRTEPLKKKTAEVAELKQTSEDVKDQIVTASSDDQITLITNTETEVIPNPIPAPVFRPQTLKTTPAFLSLHNPRNGKMVNGEVEVINTDLNTVITRVKGNSYVQLPDPKSKSGKLTLIANPFGYRKVQNVINFRQTESDTLLPHVDLVGNFYLIKFDMVRYHPGDIVTLYNVYFFNDAAIMLPESKYELNTLLEMLTENPGYRIKLHGHTNGNSRGKIISMGPSKDFFKITADAVESIGSAKELSAARAEVIKDWLVANGIEESRIEVKAWGGDRMIHDRNGTHARRNVRVEVEVLEE